MGSAKCSAESSRSGARFGNAWAIEMALKEMSMAAASDVCRDRFNLAEAASTQKELRALASERVGDSAANIPSGSVNHRHLVLQDHLCLLSGSVGALIVQNPHRYRHYDVDEMGAQFAARAVSIAVPATPSASARRTRPASTPRPPARRRERRRGSRQRSPARSERRARSPTARSPADSRSGSG